MKVVTNKKDKMPIHSIKVGQTFIDDDEIFMVCRYEGDDIYCPRCDEDISISDSVEYLAVSLTSGEIYNFAFNTQVTPIDCEARII